LALQHPRRGILLPAIESEHRLHANMGLEDFEKELAQAKSNDSRKKRDRSRSRDRHHRVRVCDPSMQTGDNDGGLTATGQRT